VRRRLLAPAGQAVELTDTEFRLLEAMIGAAPDVASRRAMAIALGETDFLAYDERRLEAAVSRLRRKLLAATGESPLRAARGRGYVFAATVRRG
jgi:DNA-binding response OmpR family regulator